DQGATEDPPTGLEDNWVTDLPSALSSAGVPVPGSVVDASTSDPPPDGWWRMNGTGLDTSSTAYDSGTSATSNLTLEGSPSWSFDNPGTGVSTGSLSLNGTSQYAQAPGPVVTSTSSFAVSAWVNLSSVPSGNVTAVSQDGSTDSSFYLGVNAGKWAFWFSDTDTTGPTQTALDGPAAAAGSWTMLTGVYNASTGQIQLYVNGTEAASAAFTPSWSATGDFAVGRSFFNGAKSDYWPGEISDVRAYDRLLWPYNVSEVYNDTGMSSVTAANAGTAFSDSAFEDYAAGEPGLRDVIVSLGANDVLQGASAATVENNLKALVTDVQDRYIDNGTGATVQALVTTIPPLGLPSGDPREAVREAVNTWLLNGNTSASLVLDIAGAVADSSSSNLVNPSYLTNGVPNSEYYSAIASAVASGIANSIPPVSL
ncbi:MAG: LamG-like jellyroll fold domain-containing protein, partial [Trebonia sp.]